MSLDKVSLNIFFCNLASMHVQFHFNSRQWTIPFFRSMPLGSSLLCSGCMTGFFTSIERATGHLGIAGLSKYKQNTKFQSVKAAVGRWTLSWQQEAHSSRRNSTGGAAPRSDFLFSFKTQLSQIEASVFSVLCQFKWFQLCALKPLPCEPLPKCMLLRPTWQASLLQVNHWHLSVKARGLWHYRTCHVLEIRLLILEKARKWMFQF